MSKFRSIPVLLMSVILLACSTQTPRLYPVNLGNELFFLERAITPAQKQRGLSHRRQLESQHGMLFIYAKPRYLFFWMQNTYFDLSIAYIDQDGKIIDIFNMYAFNKTLVQSTAPAKYALEVNQGVFEKLGIHPGQRIDLSDIPEN